MFNKNKKTVITEVEKKESYYKVDSTCCRWMNKHIDVDIFYYNGKAYFHTNHDRIPINYCPNCGKKVVINDLIKEKLD